MQVGVREFDEALKMQLVKVILLVIIILVLIFEVISDFIWCMKINIFYFITKSQLGRGWRSIDFIFSWRFIHGAKRLFCNYWVSPASSQTPEKTGILYIHTYYMYFSVDIVFWYHFNTFILFFVWLGEFKRLG